MKTMYVSLARPPDWMELADWLNISVLKHSLHLERQRTGSTEDSKLQNA